MNDDKDWPIGRWKVKELGPESPIAREWFDESGNWHTLYENGCEAVISRELLEDDAEWDSEGK